MNLEPFREPVGMSDPASQAALFEALPAEVAALASVIQGLMIHEHIAPSYGVVLAADRREEVHIRPIEARLKHMAARDARPLDVARVPGERQVGNCRHFSLLHVAMLRSKGVPARARCGFGAYFEKGKFIDHWVTEYWNAAEQRWILFDAQLDAHQRKLFEISFDPQDVPRDQFVVAGDAWRSCREGKADPEAFGILDMHGLWFIAGNLIRDVAALNNREMLPWDVWGAMTEDDAKLDLALFDRLAALTRTPDAHLEELRELCDDARITVPSTVFNAVLNRPQQV
jgi:hypothetical protein